MNKSIHRKAGLFGGAMVSALFLFPSPAPAGQTQNPSGDGPRQDAPADDEGTSRLGDESGGVLARLNLSPEQRSRIVGIRRQSEAEGRAMLQRLRRARRALDASIYADQVDDRLVEESAREVAAAQAEVIRLRAVTELKLRRVLKPEQLSILREWRQGARLRQGWQALPRNQRRRDGAIPGDALDRRPRRRQ